MTGPARITATKAFSLVADMFTILPDVFKAELLAELNAFAPRLLAKEQQSVPTRSGPRPALYAKSRPGANRPAGGLRSLLSTEVEPEELRLRSGLLTKDARSDGFYGYILDAGRGLRRGVSDSRRRMLSPRTVFVGGKGGKTAVTNRYTKPYTRKISRIEAGTFDITFGRVRAWAQDEIGPVLGRIYDRGIRAVAWSNLGGGN